MKHLALVAILAAGRPLFGQDTPPADEAPPPSLDELLGLDEDERDGAREAAEREAEEELERQLDETAITDAFAAALEKMRLSAEFLDVQFDPGLGTQRIQEEILLKLDEFIALAKQQQQQGSGSANSSSQRSQQESKDPGQKPQNQGDSQQRQEGQNPEGATDLPPGRQGDVNTVLEETRTEWGSLPARTRDELMQGRNDRYSSLYDRLTREYYRRLAEEGN